MSRQELYINEKAGKISLEIRESPKAKCCLIIAHGAGADMNHPFMNSLANGIHEQGIHVITFNFPYKEKGKKLPGSPKEAILALEMVVNFSIDKFSDTSIFLSGKSYGGRMASHLIAEQPELNIKAILYYGFPLHAPGKPSLSRADHLVDIHIPQLFFQGTNDSLANFTLIQDVAANQKNAKVISFQQADHSFKTPKSAAISTSEVFEDLVVQTVNWITANS